MVSRIAEVTEDKLWHIKRRVRANYYGHQFADKVFEKTFGLPESETYEIAIRVRRLRIC